MDSIPALKVQQWLQVWNGFSYEPSAHQTKPDDHFFLASFPANLLRRLAYQNPRQAAGPRAQDTGIQRRHDPERSRRISRFVNAGYPWATLNTQQRERFPNLQKPGWLPTTIIGNLVTSSTNRSGERPNADDLLHIVEEGGLCHIELPEGSEDPNWQPKGGVFPVEIIDGQHRLWAFEPDDERGEEFELPVVLFVDLDISWQAYLFWIINITPVRINQSFAYDLFPLLRTQDWLEPVDGPKTYRETRAQEMTEILWSHPESPWQGRIGMLGRGKGLVTQAAWVRSLTASFIRGGRGGLFVSPLIPPDPATVLRWSRAQQAAFLIRLWKAIKDAVAQEDSDWTRYVRGRDAADNDAAFMGPSSLLSTDQGVRGVLLAANEISLQLAVPLRFQDWKRDELRDAVDLTEVTECLDDLRENQSPVDRFLNEFGKEIARFDWRSGADRDLPEAIRNRQLVFRTGTGYVEVRRYLLRAFAQATDPQLQGAAQRILAEA